MTQDRPAGSRRPPVVVSHRRILALALPMTVSHMTTPLLGFVGAAVIGRLGDPALLGAMALGAVVFDVLFWSFGALRMATAGLTAQAVGAGNGHEVDRALARALVAALAVGLVLVVAQAPIGWVALTLAGASPAATAALATYFGIRIFAAPFTLCNYAILGSILGRGRTDLALVLQGAINLVNIALTIGLVSGLGWGVAGAGTATVVAEILGAVFGLALLDRLGSKPWRVPWRETMQRRAVLHMLAVNRDVMIRTMALLAAFALFAALGARAGDVTLAANAVLENMFLIGGYFLDGFATAAETLCGQAMGAGEGASFRRAARLSLGWCIGFGAAVALVFLGIGPAFIDILSTSTAVRSLARDDLPYAVLTPVLGAAAFAFDGIYVGATWTAAMRNLMLVALAVYLAILPLLQGLGNDGLWIALLGFLSVRGLGQALFYPGLVARAFPSSTPG